MSLWERAQQLPEELLEEIRSVYTDNTFPIEVRHFLSSWIEEKLLNIESHIHNEQYISELIASLIQELETKANSIHNGDLFLIKLKLIETAKIFRQKYSEDPLRLFLTIKFCLDTEMKLVARAENLGNTHTFMNNDKMNIVINDSLTQIKEQFGSLRQNVCENATFVRRIEEEQEAFAILYHDCTKLNATLQQISTSQSHNHQSMEIEKKLKRQKQDGEMTLTNKVACVVHLRVQSIDRMKDTITKLSILQSRILDEELISWKRDQQLAGNGVNFSGNLDVIQNWCENLADVIWSTRQHIKDGERLKEKFQPFEGNSMLPNMYPTLNTQITQLISSLVTSTFIIEKQPPQVMKTNTRFTSTVRLLVGTKLNVHMTPPQVKASIISESQANALLKNDKMKNSEVSGEILNNTGSMEFHQTVGQLSVSFRNMQLKKIKRAEKKGTESVMDEKFSLLFQSTFAVGGGELVFHVWTLSLPVVVIVHGNQEPHAWATVTWDNAFSEAGRVPFLVPDKVLWRQVAEALNMKFRAATGRALTPDHLRFLAEKAFRGTVPQDYSNTPLSWAQFCKEPLPERSFTFWEWFYAIMKLTREHLKNPWVDGCILGFVRKKQAEEILANCQAGTFLMRFSDSELGGITIAWVGEQKDQVFMLQPFTGKDFAIRSLADRIYDLQHLLYLYPNLNKDQVFSKYCTPVSEQASTNGYIKPQLVTQVPAWSTPGFGGQTPSHSSVGGINNNSQAAPSGSYPATPQTIFQTHSPDPSVRDTPSVASSYAPGLGQSSIGQPSSDLDMELMQPIDENLNLDQLQNFNFNLQDFTDVSTYNAIKPQ
ncbi:signal transducer and activator of transcription 5B isoform X1 [Formica exsecta]|uniref:signal transducer and activator of transcription 5B isoform X1 n=1 Tax=Formica exsecta TaxID=72781 RepID=UPI001143203D|nr:signal transducer and activator of transcription 5B isoform X1 [Formica exsecta]XP_029671601.1 signal transducer and activator of transcription 5B isoform X1 [Formica exsecta]XP_029671610.1 signal transducer and activator of transcription 5B isoform X1 [Formica exsecta]